jgi:DNA polymerase-4
VEKCGRRLRDQGRVTRRVGISIDYSDGRRCIRQARIEPPSANDLAIFPFARQTLQSAWTRRVRIRHLRLSCDRLVYPPAQLPLFETEQRTTVRQQQLVAAMDRIRDRFGHESVGRLGQSVNGS